MGSLCRISFMNAAYFNRCLYLKGSSRGDIIMKNVIKSPSLPLKSIKLYSKAVAEEDELDNTKPVKFSTSEAAKWKAEYSRRGEADDDSPPSQPYIVTFSIAAFLVYFCILREENDIDMKISGGPLNDPFANIELVQLQVVVEEDIRNNRKTDENVLNRLKELEELAAKLAQ